MHEAIEVVDPVLKVFGLLFCLVIAVILWLDRPPREAVRAVVLARNVL